VSVVSTGLVNRFANGVKFFAVRLRHSINVEQRDGIVARIVHATNEYGVSGNL